MKALKIGVLTFHRCINYGSYWQARCLVEGLNARGHHATILDHDSGRVNMAEWKCAMQPVLPTPVPKADRALYREKMTRFFQAFESLPLSPRFQMDNPVDMEHYDVVVVGSDEVWNLTHPWFGKCPLFYGDGLRTDRLVSYAASFGNYQAHWGLDPVWAGKLLNFNSISVRDENSFAIVNAATGIVPEMVIDPCLQFPGTIHEGLVDDSSQREPYIALYGHNFTESFTLEIKRYAYNQKLRVISIGYRNDWADEQWITPGPLEFAGFIAGAQAVATNFFHGCVFALINHKPFVCETTPYRTNKLQGLMAKIGGEEHLVPEGTPSLVYDTFLSEPLNPAIHERINLLREASNTYLDRALGHKQLQLA